MAVYDFGQLREKYGDFHDPSAVIRINGSELGGELQISDINIELTCGFEASIAEFSIYNAYSREKGSFAFEAVKKYIFLGSKTEIFLGYGKKAKLVFTGLLSRVSFRNERMDIPCIRLTAMDVKAVMMAGSYSAQLKAVSYSDAVREILQKTAYEKLKASGVITAVSVTDTPDRAAALQGAAGKDKALQMTAESDYDFVVKAAKKYNYEFFTECGNVIFRRAKSDRLPLLTIGPNTGLRSFDVTYDITGLVEKVSVRGVNPSRAEVISANKKLANKISHGNRARPVIRGSRRVYLDSTVGSRAEAQSRADFLAEETAYRLGSLECELVGLPELFPGRFLDMSGLGTGADNRFYLKSVRHILRGDGGFSTIVKGMAAGMKETDRNGII